VSSPEPLVSIVVVSFNTKEVTLRCLQSLFMQRGVKATVYVVDNGSVDGSLGAISEHFPEVRLIEMGRNAGFGPANNAAVSEVEDPFVLLINSDAWFNEPTALRDMIGIMRDEPKCAVLGPRLVGTDGRVQIGARRFPSMLREALDRTELCRLLPEDMRSRSLLGRHAQPVDRIECDWVTGACMLVSLTAFREVGGFPPEVFMYGEELDLCMRLKRGGWRVLFDPSVEVTHAGGGSGAGPWKVKAATAHERYALARDRGATYAWCFTAVRAASAMVEWLLFGGAALVRRTEYHRLRARQARSVGWAALEELSHAARTVGPPGALA